MILVADSGSTKTAWKFIDDNRKVHSFHTLGFNPFFWTSKEIITEINKKCPKKLKSEISSHKSQICFYGAGCSSKQRTKIVKTALKKVFPKCKIEVEHDLLGAARAVCGNEKGIACILGTGSNSCFYDGKKIVRNIGGLGHILGDEGSGKEIGKKLLNAYLNRFLPENIHKTFQRKYRLSKEKILNPVYRKQRPNQYLASFTKFAGQNIREPFLHDLVKKCFLDFFDSHVCMYVEYKNVPVGFVGSVGFHFRHIVQEIANEKGIGLHKIIENPMDELVEYHSGFHNN